MKVLLVEPGAVPRPAEIDPSLEAMQEAVNGLVEAIYPFDEPVALVCNEEGKLLGLPLNRALKHPNTGRIYDIIAGTFFLCSAPPDREEFASLTDEQMSHYMGVFQTVERFIGGEDL